MAELAELGELLIDCRVVDRARWDEAVRAGGGDLGDTLDALASAPPAWWDEKPPVPPGLTDYQRQAIADRFAADELAALWHDLALNRFLLLGHLGRGGQGRVFRGRQLNPPRYVAIKTLVRDNDLARQRFEREAKAMMQVSHPSVARFYLYERVRERSGRPTDEYLIAMEFVPGVPLHRLVHRLGFVSWRFALHWAAQLLDGLTAIHRGGLVHGDVKPENVMVRGPEPKPGADPGTTAAKLLDFGAVVRVGDDDESEAARTFVGTPQYAAPEQWTGPGVAASDVYAVGGTVFFALTGKWPYQKERGDRLGFRDAHTKEPVPDARQMNPLVPSAVNRLVRRMMAKAPDQRGTADELADECRRLLEGRTAELAALATTPPPKPAGKPKPQARTVVTAEAGLSRAERVAAVLRRPVVLLVLLVVLVLLLYWVL